MPHLFNKMAFATQREMLPLNAVNSSSVRWCWAAPHPVLKVGITLSWDATNATL